MPVDFRTYHADSLFGSDYNMLRDFLIRRGSTNYHFGRWDWMITHPNLDPSGLARIGFWEDSGRVVALATYDCALGRAYLLMDDEHQHLAGELIDYAEGALAKDGKCMVLIRDGDEALQSAASRRGFVATQERECDAVYPIDDPSRIAYRLPDGFRVTSMGETYDLYKYLQVLWKGFNHEINGEGPFMFADGPQAEAAFRRPNVNLDLKIAVVAPNGDFVSYCGMWQDGRSGDALVEPVATDPAYRRMGLGRAAVLEAVRRCGKLGAKRALVGSSQQFYYSIGFRPYQTSSFWSR